MIIPKFSFNYDADAVFEIFHTSEDKKEVKKEVLDRKVYKTEIVINPISKEIVKFDCECPDFNINKQKSLACKHIKSSIDLLIPLLSNDCPR